MSIINFWLSFNDCAETALKYGHVPLSGYQRRISNLLSADAKHPLLQDMIAKIIRHDDTHREKVGTAVFIGSGAAQQSFIADKENAVHPRIKVSSFQAYEAIAFRLWKYFNEHEPKRKIFVFLDRTLLGDLYSARALEAIPAQPGVVWPMALQKIHEPTFNFPLPSLIAQFGQSSPLAAPNYCDADKLLLTYFKAQRIAEIATRQNEEVPVHTYFYEPNLDVLIAQHNAYTQPLGNSLLPNKKLFNLQLLHFNATTRVINPYRDLIANREGFLTLAPRYNKRWFETLNLLRHTQPLPASARALTILKPLHEQEKITPQKNPPGFNGIILVNSEFKITERMVDLKRATSVTPESERPATAAAAAADLDAETAAALDAVSLSSPTSLSGARAPQWDTLSILSSVSITSHESFVEIPETEIPEGWLLLGSNQAEPEAAKAMCTSRQAAGAYSNAQGTVPANAAPGL